jgi:protein-L-isoaspartate(D-aspartate) O-methyltransferase
MGDKERLKAMVREQIARRGLRSRRVVGAFLRVDRGVFVPSESAGQAYGDHPVSIGCGQTISQPYMVALMLDALELSRGMRVLEVGSGSGYVLALLAAMGAKPFGIEWHAQLVTRARENLEAAGFKGIPLRQGDGGLGWPQMAPFHRVLVSAGCPAVPPPLLEQLAPGGILVAPVDEWTAQVLVKCKKGPAGVAMETLEGCVFVPLVGKFGRAQ